MAGTEILVVDLMDAVCPDIRPTALSADAPLVAPLGGTMLVQVVLWGGPGCAVGPDQAEQSIDLFGNGRPTFGLRVIEEDHPIFFSSKAGDSLEDAGLVPA